MGTVKLSPPLVIGEVGSLQIFLPVTMHQSGLRRILKSYYDRALICPFTKTHRSLVPSIRRSLGRWSSSRSSEDFIIVARDVQLDFPESVYH